MNTRTYLNVSIVLLILISVACTLGGNTGESPTISEEEAIATSVAATLEIGRASCRERVCVGV